MSSSNPNPTPDSSPLDAGPLPVADPADRAGGACRDLLDAARRFATTAAEARQRLEGRLADGERLHREGRSRSQHEREQALASAERAREETIERENHRYGERLQRIDRELENARQEAIDRAEQSEEETRKLLADAVWLADSVHESGLERNQRDVDAVRERIAEARAVLEELRERLRTHLRRCRQGLPKSAVDEERIARESKGATAVPVALLDLRKHAEAIEKLTLPLVFRNVFPLLLLLPGAAIGATAMAFRDGGDGLAIGLGAGAGVGASLLLLLLAHGVAKAQVRRIYRSFSTAAAIIDRSAEVAVKEAAEARKRADAKLDGTLAEETAQAKATYEPVLAEVVAKREARIAQLAELRPKYREKARTDRDEAIAAAERAARETADATERRHRDEMGEIDRRLESNRSEAGDEHDRIVAANRDAWTEAQRLFSEASAALDALAAPRAVPWTAAAWSSWNPADAPGLPIAVGRLRFEAKNHLADAEHAADLPSPLPEAVDLPLLLDLPARRGLLIETDAEQRDRGLAALQAAVLRILTTLPAGKVRLTLVDPVGLGANFAGFMHLADEDQQLVGDRIWTEPRHIEQRLTDLTEHMETVIQKYLRNEFDSIDAYNEKAGEIAEPYRVLVVADLPANLTETAAKRLASILESGARCGVLTLVLRDLRAELPPTLKAEDLARGVVRLAPQESGRLAAMIGGLEALPLSLDEEPPADLLQSLAGRIGSSARDASRVEVPFEAIAPAGDRRWSMDSGSKLAVSLGRAGATRLQQLVLGVGTAQHVLIAGKTGSGKSTLLHAMISNLCAWYGPDQVQLYLVDFKKGVEFKTYATHRLPHVKAVAVESDREFGLSVLQGLDAELKRRGDLFRAAGTQDLKGFRAARPDEPMPRTLLVIDEFQELFTEDDRVASEAGLLLDRIARQGRAFGVHAVLGSQTLGGAYSIARSTMGQMGVRIALQCSEADAQVILSDDNSAARLLSRPGEAIYNDAGGLVEGNSPFQVVWLSEEVRDRVLADVVALAGERGLPPALPLVFEGSAPASLESNAPLAGLLRNPAPPDTRELLRWWIGDPVAIRDPACAEFRRQPGANLVVVGQQIETTLGMLASGVLGAAAQREASRLRVWAIDGTPSDDPSFGVLPGIVERLPGEHRVLSVRNLPDALTELAEEIVARQDDPARESPTTVLLIHGLHRFRDLRRAEDDYGFSADDGPPKPDKLFASILREGPPVGVHVVASADTVPNLQRVVDRSGLREFDWRVALQMGAGDSSTLIDTPLASRLGMTRGYLHSEEQGLLEKFRPYPPPEGAFIDATLARLGERTNG